jgi:hypothetical protein
MTDHTPQRAAAIEAAARAAGAHDPSEIPALIPAGVLLNPSDAISKLRVSKPYLFKPPVAELSAGEYQAAKQSAVRASEAQRRHADLVRITENIAKSYQKKGRH